MYLFCLDPTKTWPPCVILGIDWMKLKKNLPLLKYKSKLNNLLFSATNVRDASQKSITGDACCFLTIR